MANAEALVLRTTLGAHDHVRPLRDGRVSSERIRFDFRDYDPLPKGFRAMVRGDELDVSEMAIITHLMAHHYGRPLVGLAMPLWSRLPHANLVCPVESDIKGPKDLEGKTAGVRAYGQTSGVWVRGILESEYGVDLDKIQWVTMEDAHLSEYEDPANCTRYTGDLKLRDLMLAGELAAIMGERVVSPESIRTVVPDAENAARAWIEKSGLVPINHTVVFQAALHEAHPWLARELAELFTEARRVAIEEDGATPPPEYGFEANRASLQLAFDYAHRQAITPRLYKAEELFLPL